MNVQLPLRMDKTAFLGWVQGRKERYELDRGRVVMMTGGSRAHLQITFNLAKALDARLDPTKWAVLPEFGGIGFSVGREMQGIAGMFEQPSDVRRWIAEMVRGGQEKR